MGFFSKAEMFHLLQDVQNKTGNVRYDVLVLQSLNVVSPLCTTNCANHYPKHSTSKNSKCIKLHVSIINYSILIRVDF